MQEQEVNLNVSESLKQLKEVSVQTRLKMSGFTKAKNRTQVGGASSAREFCSPLLHQTTVPPVNQDVNIGRKAVKSVRDQDAQAVAASTLCHVVFFIERFFKLFLRCKYIFILLHQPVHTSKRNGTKTLILLQYSSLVSISKIRCIKFHSCSFHAFKPDSVVMKF